MTISVNSVNNNVSYTGRDDNDKVRVSEVGVVGGATVGGAKYGIGSIKKFRDAKNLNTVEDLINLSTKTTQKVKTAANASKGLEALWAKMAVNAAKYKKAISEWAEKYATGRLAKNIVKSPVFGKVSAAIGGIAAIFVFISGLGEMGNTYSKMVQKPQYAEYIEA